MNSKMMDLVGSKMSLLELGFSAVASVVDEAMELLDAVTPEHVLLFANDTDAENGATGLTGTAN